MKKIFSTIAFLTICYSAKSQLTLEHTYPNTNPSASGQVIVFSSNGTKIMMSDTGTSQVKLYNTDHTLWKTINLPVYTGYKFNIALAVSDNLFNSDNLVELVASYVGTGGNYKSQVINENGTVIQDLGSAYYANIHIIDGAYKLFAFSIGGASYTYSVYSLPGTIPCGQCGALGVQKTQDVSNSSGISEPIPNPNSGYATIHYTLPEGVYSGMITIYNANGEKVKTYNIGSNAQFITLDNSNLPSGVYYYNMSGEGIVPSANKMIIVK